MNENPVHNNVLLLGRACAGKDTFADYLVDKYGYTKISFATPIYTIANDLFDMQQKDRPLLQAIGQGMRQIKPTVFVQWAYRKAQEYERVVISDCRQGNEYDYGVDAGFLPVRISAALELRVLRAVERDLKVTDRADAVDKTMRILTLGDRSLLDISKWENESETGADGKPCIEVNNDYTLDRLYETAEDIIFHASSRQMLSR